MGVEAVDAVFDDVGPAGDREFLLGLHLGGQAVAVPAEATVDPVAPHGLVAGDNVFYVAGQQVSMVGQAVGERGAIVEDVLRLDGAGVDGGQEGAVGSPAGQHAVLDGREVGSAHFWVGGVAHDRAEATGAVRGSRACRVAGPGPRRLSGRAGRRPGPGVCT